MRGATCPGTRPETVEAVAGKTNGSGGKCRLDDYKVREAIQILSLAFIERQYYNNFDEAIIVVKVVSMDPMRDALCIP